MRCTLLLVALVAALCSRASAYYDRERYKAICLADNTNDDAIYLNAEQLIKRSGFDYEEYFTIANDGYVTRHLRLINNKIDRSKMRKPPVLLYHGANIDQTAYIMSSSIQHFPEKWPREAGDSDVRSSNRSLGFMLSNNGYDVWLMGQRGSNKANQAYTDNVAGTRAQPNFRPTEENYRLIKENRRKYWSYGLDDIIANEIGPQIDTVVAVTGSQEFTIFSFSLSTPTTMAFLAMNPDYAHRTRTYLQMAPAIAADHFTFVDKIYFEKLCPYFPTRGIGFAPFYSAKPAVRELIIQTSKSKELRYKLIYRFVTSLFGPSQKYFANLERNLLAHVFMPVSFKSVQHYCQNSLNKKLTKFNYGRLGNQQRYNQSKPPEYNLSELEVTNYVVISGTYDGLADATTVQRVIERTHTPKPAVHIVCEGCNHIDYLAAVENDKFVNLPILNELNKNSD